MTIIDREIQDSLYDPAASSRPPKKWFTAMLKGIISRSDVKDAGAVVGNIWKRLTPRKRMEIKRRELKGESFQYDLPLPQDVPTKGIGTLRVVKPFNLVEAQVNVSARDMAAMKRVRIFSAMKRNDGTIAQVARCKSKDKNVNIFVDSIKAHRVVENKNNDDVSYIPKIAIIPGLEMKVIEDKKDIQQVIYTIPGLPEKYSPQIIYDSAQFEATDLGGYDFDGNVINLVLENFEKYPEKEQVPGIMETLKHEYVHYLEDKFELYNTSKKLPQYFIDLKNKKLKEEGNFFSMEQPGTRKADMEVIAYALQHLPFKSIMNIFVDQIGGKS